MKTLLAATFTIALICSAQTPSLELLAIIGDARGKCVNNVSVATTSDGTIYLLMQNGRVAIYDPDGTYRESSYLPITWPASRFSLQSDGSHIYLGNRDTDLAWAEDLARRGSTPGHFQPPLYGILANNLWFIADGGNRRLQVFDPEHLDQPKSMIELPAVPKLLAVSGQEVAVLTDRDILHLYRLDPDGTHTLILSGNVPRKATSIALAPDGQLLVATPDSLYALNREGDKLGEPRLVAQSWQSEWPNLYPSATAMTTGPDGDIWFLDQERGQVLRLDPTTDRVQPAIAGIDRPSALAFDPLGRLLVANRKAFIWRYDLTIDPPQAEQLAGGKPLYTDENVPIWGLLPASDGSLLVRSVEEGWRKGWPAITLHRLLPDSSLVRFHDFGPLYAERCRFGPWEAYNAMALDSTGRILLALSPMQAIIAFDKDGSIVWEASRFPTGGADEVPFEQPRDIAIDSHDNIWVVDSANDAIFCLSPEGRLLLRHGRAGTVDDRSGAGFAAPTGIAITRDGDTEHLYIGDAGNHRLLHFRINR